MKRTLTFLILLAILISACASVPGAGTVAPESGSPAESPSGPKNAPEMETPGLEETQDPNTPVSSEDTPDAQGGGAGPSPLEPLPDEENLVRGNVFLDEADILVLESFPVQIVLHLSGQLPSPCHNLRANLAEPDKENRIEIEVFSLIDPGVMCAQVVKDFETRINLGSFPSGSYTVWVNGEQIGEFTS
jgi:hypothetical protein